VAADQASAFPRHLSKILRRGACVCRKGQHSQRVRVANDPQGASGRIVQRRPTTYTVDRDLFGKVVQVDAGQPHDETVK
jgi:hypothetical protein